MKTPPVGEGLLPGITRAFVLELCDGAGAEARETVLDESDLLQADEAFLTSTTREIVPIVRVDGAAIGDGRVGPITRRLIDAFRARVATAV